MREIKFRAWDKEEKEMVSWKTLIDCCDLDYLFGNVNETPKRVTIPDFEVMQYTGLKDRNGMDIYEEDIIGFDWGDYYFTAIVRKGGWYWYGEMVFRNDTLNFEEIGNEDDMTADCDVLGNIYENPVLLERDN